MYGDKQRTRRDGPAKVSGRLKYLTDLTFANMLYGKILRSAHPHAKIRSIHTEKAEKLTGVRAVITHKDVPGLNSFGLITPDQPVFCNDVIRYVGDAVAAVAADTAAVAEQALALIEVDYQPLPVVDSPEKALTPDTPALHPGGNVMHRAGHQHGSVIVGFNAATVIIEEVYEVPRQMHTYMETEGGVIAPEKDGGITVYVGTQHGYKDRFQLARILNIPEEKIRIISSPIGGSFGGKDELNIQPYGAILALKTGRPVKIHQTRRESILSGLKRHPMRIEMKTAARKDGKLLAHEVKIIADTGAYSTLGPAVLDFAVEHATGPYRIPNVAVEGISVFTNNGVAGEFRGFGGNQVTFALEGQLDRLAERLHLDPLELRRRNLRKEEDPGSLGQRIAKTNGAEDVLNAVSGPYEQKKKEVIIYNHQHKWKKRGAGIAITMHGGGLGYGRLDPAGGRLSFTCAGNIEVAFSFEEFGQGILAVIETIVVAELGCSADDLTIVIGDTAKAPHSGSTTASRGTSMVWTAIRKMKDEFLLRLLAKASVITGLPVKALRLGRGGIFSAEEASPVITYQELASSFEAEHPSDWDEKQYPVTITTSFDFPTTPDKIDSGHFLFSFSAVLAEVEVDLLTGKVRIADLQQYVAAGPVVNKIGYLGQIEGGGVMALGYTLMEEAKIVGGKYVTENLDTYLIPGINDVPFPLYVEPIEALSEGDLYGPRGVGEIGTVAVAPAITKAIHDATGHWLCRLPAAAEEILQAGQKRRKTNGGRQSSRNS
ncbi:xanthine dehydrogenase subunit D [Bacillaceae bacterium Marseille-Q3522]|nr:xanthine dehydrogenase subunit D [Bacillaceae bacterium Marseille-Q3522]